MRRVTVAGLFAACLFLATMPTRAEDCAYDHLVYGPHASFALVDDAVLSPDGGFLAVRKGTEATRIVFANGGGDKIIETPSDQKIVVVSDHEIGLASKGEWTALDVRSEARRPLGREARNIGVVYNRFSASHGKIVLKTLYATVMLLKIMPEDATAYAQFRADMLEGKYCGVDVQGLQEPQKQRAAALFAFMMYDDVSEGRMDDFAAWKAREKAINALVTSHLYDALVEAYCFRISDAAQADPVLSKIDPNKVWSFAWTALAEFFQNNHELIKTGEFGHFTDVSAWQRHDRLVVTLMGTQPIEGGTRNVYGFYHKAVGETDLRGVRSARKLDYDWTQGAKTYHATLSLSPRERMDDNRPKNLPAGARAGLVIFDKTLDPAEVRDASGQYRAYFEAAGFKFAPARPLPDVVAYLTRERPPQADYIVRDGHADGDDDDLIVLYEDGFVARGEKPATGESVEFIYNLTENSKVRRLDYDEFASLLARRGGKNPLVYLDTSCWGLEKAWVSLAHFKASQLLQLSSRTPVNQFRASGAADATGILLDAIRSGEDFAGVRKRMMKTPDYAAGQGDNVIFPDEAAYPQAHRLVKVRRDMFVREGDKPQAAYYPDGYY